MVTHPLQRRLLVEELMRRRLPEEGRRYAAAQRRGRIDANPHQIDAVVFALRRLPEGGCILADEVGLGKTIEAGLVVSQLLAEGTRRVLLVVPKSLVGQWKAELLDLFGIDAREVRADPDSLRGDGVFLVHRELAGGEKGAPLLWASDPFELVIVDEAHELFASIYKRYAKDGSYDTTSKHAQTAHRVRELVRRHGAPVLLLTATPIQNSLLELWGLVQYVESTGSLLGRLTTFRELFCEEGDRAIAPGQAHELRRRLRTVLHRTLRRQADAFLAVPFVRRRARVVSYSMSVEERALYEDVAAWLLSPDRVALSGGRLILIGFLRRMASSLAALAASLRKVASRTREILGDAAPIAGDAFARIGAEFAADLEDDGDDAEGDDDDRQPVAPATAREALRRDLAVLEAFAARAETLSDDTKARHLVGFVHSVRELGAAGKGTGKLIIFTESLTTQSYLEGLLLRAGYAPRDITLFRGDNDGPRAREALAVWDRDVGAKMVPEMRPSRDVALRLALVHEFRHRSSVFISTEAGAKGLNLQFCETLVNYDLPWNPQRIEQRIGRIHRYGQVRDVTIVNFLARDNEAERLLFDILSKKLELFGTVLDQSDAVLHEAGGVAPESLVSAVGLNLQAELESAYDGARSLGEVTDRLGALQRSLDARRAEFDAEQDRVSGLIETRLDDAVRQVFRGYEARINEELAALDHDLDRVLRGYLVAGGIRFEHCEADGTVTYRLASSPLLPPRYRDGGMVRVGRSSSSAEADVLYVGHPLIEAAVSEARAATKELRPIALGPSDGEWPPELRVIVGRRGRIVLTRIAYRGLEPVDHLVSVALLEDEDAALPAPVVTSLLRLQSTNAPKFGAPLRIDVNAVADAVEEVVLASQAEVTKQEHGRFERMLGQLDHYLADQALLLRRRREGLAEQLERLQKRHQGELAFAARAKQGTEAERLQKELARLDERIEALSRGEDDEYRGWVARLHERRYQRPQVERLFEVDFVVGP